MKIIRGNALTSMVTAAVFLAAVTGWMVDKVAPTHVSDVIPWIVGIVALVALVWLMRSSSWSDGIWHPLVGIGVYVTLVCFGPIVFLLITNEPLGILRPEHILDRTVIAMALTVIGMLVGITVGLIGASSYAKVESVGNTTQDINYNLIATFGTLVMAVSTIGRLFAVVLLAGRKYGADQLEVTALSLLWTATQSLIFVGVILSCLGNIPLGRLMTKIDWTMLFVFALASMLYGSRGFLIAPIVFLAFARHRWIQPLPLARLAPLGVLVVLVFVWLGQARVGTIQDANETIRHPQAIVEEALRHISSPYMLTNDVAQRVPDQFEFTSGSTYIAAVVRQIPGPISLKLFGQPDGTGAMVYRQIMEFWNPDMGYGFAFPAEAYLNFGLTGNLIMSCGLGWLLGAAYRWNKANRISPKTLLYPIMLATFIVGFRTDALGHIKVILYPMLVVTAVWIIAHRSRANHKAIERAGAAPVDLRGFESP